MLASTTFWTATAFVLFFVLIWKMGGFAALTGGLDARAERIAKELAEARRLRDEAEDLVKDYDAKRRAAEAEAKAIVKAAKAEAERLASEAQAKLEAFVTRRTAEAEAKIAQAEAQAFTDVRNAAADAALKAAEAILREDLAGKGGDALVAKGLAEVKARLN